MDDDREMNAIETEIAFLSREMEKINDCVFEQQKQLDALTQGLRAIKAQLDAQQGEPADRRPPHY